MGKISMNPYPNPFKEKVTLHYSLPFSTGATLNLYTIKGNLLYTYELGFQKADYYNYFWFPENLPSGNYFFAIKIKNENAFCKAILLK